MFKKGELTINYIILLIIALIVLVVVVLIFLGGAKEFAAAIKSFIQNIFNLKPDILK